MTTTNKNLVPTKFIENTQTTQYTNNVVKTHIDKCVVTNVGSARATLDVNIVKNSLTASSSNKVISNKVLEVNESYLCPELIGIVLESGDFISTLASLASTLNINVCGREIS